MPTYSAKTRKKSQLSFKNVMIASLFILFAIGAVSAMYLSTRNQDVRQQAATAGNIPAPYGTTKPPGKLLPVTPPPKVDTIGSSYSCLYDFRSKAVNAGHSVCYTNAGVAAVVNCPDRANDIWLSNLQIDSDNPSYGITHRCDSGQTCNSTNTACTINLMSPKCSNGGDPGTLLCSSNVPPNDKIAQYCPTLDTTRYPYFWGTLSAKSNPSTPTAKTLRCTDVICGSSGRYFVNFQDYEVGLYHCTAQ